MFENNYMNPDDFHADHYEMENNSELTPVFKEPNPVYSIKPVDHIIDYSNPAESGFKEENALLKVDQGAIARYENVMNNVMKFSDDYLQSKVTSIQTTISEPRVQEGLKAVGLNIQAEDLTYQRAKLGLAVFGAYKLLSHPALSKYSLFIGAGIAYFVYNRNEATKNKVATLSQGVDNATKEMLGAYASVCNRRTGSFV